MTKYICFQYTDYSVAYCSHLSGSDVLWEPVRCSRDRWWRPLLWAVWVIPTCSSLIKVQRWTASIIEMSCFINSFCQPFAMCLVTSLLFKRTMLLPTGHTRPCSCWLGKHRLHRSSSVASQHSWPNPVDYQIWGKMQERVYCSRIHDVDQLKSRLIEEWKHLHQVLIDETIRQWCPIFELAFEHMEDILNTDFSYVWYMYRHTLFQLYVCAVAYSGHFCFGVTSLNPLELLQVLTDFT